MPPLCAITETRRPPRGFNGTSDSGPGLTAGLNVGQSACGRLANPSEFGPITAMPYCLHPSTGLARLFSEPRTENDRGADTRFTAAAQFLDDERRGNDQHGEVDRARHIANRRIGFEALHLGVGAAHRMDAAGIGMRAQDLEDAPAQALTQWRGADHRDAARRKQLGDVRQFSHALAHRSPSPRAMMPRRTSVVPPWMVSFGAIVVA